METILPGAAHLQNIHPLMVHFPLAFFPGAVFLYLVSWRLKDEQLSWCAFWMLVFGAAGGIAAAATGLWGEEGVMVSRSVRGRLLEVHETYMLVTAGLGILLAAWAVWKRPFPVRFRPLFCFLLAVLLVVMTKGADYGGRMVFDYNAGGDACGQPIEFSK